MTKKVFRIIGIAVIMLACVTVIRNGISPAASGTAGATGTSYRYEVEYDEGGGAEVWVDLQDAAHLSTGEEDYAAYKTENDARIAGWVATPGSAPAIEQRYVQVTFEHPLTAAAVQSITQAASFQVTDFILVAQRSTGEETFDVYYGPVNATEINELIATSPSLRPGCAISSSNPSCYSTAYTGIMQVSGMIASNGLKKLNYLKQHADVYLCDSTWIDLVSGGALPFLTATVSLPNAIFSNSNQISWP